VLDLGRGERHTFVMMHDQMFTVILPAAGSGTRFGASGGSGDKLLVEIGGLCILQHSVAAFEDRLDVASIILVTARDRFELYQSLLASVGLGAKVTFVEGGRERWESVLFGLRRAAEIGGMGFAAVHDAARPLVSPRVIEEAFATARERGAALPCVAEPATLKRRAADGGVQETVDRRGLYQAQTPQCFELAKLLEGYEQLLAAGGGGDLTDDAQVYERMGWAVAMTMGDPTNVKITTGPDVVFAEAILAARGAQ
jgi:2-C-methyl-D-erythritol 4-phosphate cytidylyltransferase